MPEPHLSTRLIAEFLVALDREGLPPEERQRIAAEFAAASAEMRPPRWAPNPGPQALAYISEADELYFGGSLGPGKTALLLGLALTAHSKSLLLRLQGTHLSECKDQLAAQLLPGDSWKQIGHGGELWTYDHRKLEMLGCDDEKRLSSLQGRPHDAKLYDELPQHKEAVYRQLNAWCRTTIPGQRCRIVGAGNPPLKATEEWVLRYWGPWLNEQHPDYPAIPGELKWFAVIDGKEEQVADGKAFMATFKNRTETIQPLSRTFIPALLEHNPDFANSNYRARLQGLEEPLRSKLLFGDMQIGRADDANQLIPSEWVRKSMRDWTAGWGGAARSLRLTAAAVDCSRGGDDDTVLGKRYGDWIAPLDVWPGHTVPDGPAAVRLFLPRLEITQTIPIYIDLGASAGGGVVDTLNIARRANNLDLNVIPVAFGSKSVYKDKTGMLTMGNLRAEIYWRLREALDPANGTPLKLPNDDKLLAELCSVRYDSDGFKVRIEDKDDIKKRLRRSPDRADAVAMLMLASRVVNGGWIPREEKPDVFSGGQPAPRWVPRSGGGGGGFMGMR